MSNIQFKCATDYRNFSSRSPPGAKKRRQYWRRLVIVEVKR
ncbi:MAG: hypothetical protein ACMG55_19040 [Microcoleus sp.]